MSTRREMHNEKDMLQQFAFGAHSHCHLPATWSSRTPACANTRILVPHTSSQPFSESHCTIKLSHASHTSHASYYFKFVKHIAPGGHCHVQNVHLLVLKFCCHRLRITSTPRTGDPYQQQSPWYGASCQPRLERPAQWASQAQCGEASPCSPRHSPCNPWRKTALGFSSGH